MKGTGVEHRTFVHAPTIDTSIAAEDQIQKYLELWNDDGLARELSMELTRARSDALVLDCMLLGAMAAAERSGLPWAVLVHFLYAPSVAGSWGLSWEGVRGRVNAAREATGCDSFPPGDTLLHQSWQRASRVLVATAEAFDEPLAARAANVRYVGPLRPDTASEWTWDLPWSEDDPRALVCVSLSTTEQRQEPLLQRILDALGALPVRVVVTSGAVDAGRLRLPPNAVARQWVPHRALFPRASVVLTHAGHGTALLAVSCGVPLVCIPMGRDQHVVGERIARLGLGTVVAKDAATEEIRGAVERVLGDPSYRQRARSLSVRIQNEAKTVNALNELEALLAWAS
jgi:UDP:flavonoid glycosyltransferase YjiC (YdhE family)